MRPSTPPPAPPVTGAPLPLTDPEVAELDDLLASVPEPFQALDVVMLDGYLCGVLAQPEGIDPARWLPPALDWNFGDPGAPEADPAADTATQAADDADAPTASVTALGPDSPGWHAAKHERLLTLITRHHAVLERQLREDGWFDPLVMQPEDDEGRPLQGRAAIGPALAPWVVGFEHALNHFSGLESLTDADLPDLLACLRRHLPAQEDDEVAFTQALDQEHPLRGLDEAIEDLVGNVVAMADLARGERLKVETVRRAGPKVGRNDPCPCGSGRKYKQCHGKGEAGGTETGAAG
jgi:uncharacterized protein